MSNNGVPLQSNTDPSMSMYDACMPNKIDDITEQILRNHYPLHRACRDGDEEKVQALLQLGGCDVYEEDGLRGWTPMHWAASVGSLKCLMVFSEHGVSMDAGNHRVNQTPTHIAAQHGCSHCLLWLINSGAATARQDNMGDTPLHKAARGGRLDCVSLLAPHGPAISIQNHNGNTPLDEARLCQNSECITYLERALATQQTGISSGASVCAPIAGALGSGLHTLAPRSSSHILMNGEPIYINQGVNTNTATTPSSICRDQEMDMDDETEPPPAAGLTAWGLTSGVKRSLDDSDDSSFKRQRRFEPSSREKLGTAFNNNVLSSYNAVLAMSVEPVKGTSDLQNSNMQVHVSSLPSPSLSQGFPCTRADTPYVGNSSMLEHCHSLQAQYGYDASLIGSICDADHMA